MSVQTVDASTLKTFISSEAVNTWQDADKGYALFQKDAMTWGISGGSKFKWTMVKQPMIPLTSDTHITSGGTIPLLTSFAGEATGTFAIGIEDDIALHALAHEIAKDELNILNRGEAAIISLKLMHLNNLHNTFKKILINQSFQLAAPPAGNFRSFTNLISPATTVYLGLDENAAENAGTAPFRIPSLGRNITIDDLEEAGDIVTEERGANPAKILGLLPVVQFTNLKKEARAAVALNRPGISDFGMTELGVRGITISGIVYASLSALDNSTIRCVAFDLENVGWVPAPPDPTAGFVSKDGLWTISPFTDLTNSSGHRHVFSITEEMHLQNIMKRRDTSFFIGA